MSVLSRQLLGAVAVLAFSGSSVLAVRGLSKPYAPDAPAFRQKGDPAARAVIVEFSDFQCPACRMGASVMKSIEALHGSRVRVVFKHFPLRRHPRAPAAAAAAECAGRQGRFWEMHDALFESQEEWHVDYSPQWMEVNPDWPLKYAKRAGVDDKILRECLASPEAARSVAADLKDGENQWIGSTPTFFINGRRFVGGQQLSTLGSLWIERQLKKG